MKKLKAILIVIILVILIAGIGITVLASVAPDAVSSWRLGSGYGAKIYDADVGYRYRIVGNTLAGLTGVSLGEMYCVERGADLPDGAKQGYQHYLNEVVRINGNTAQFYTTDGWSFGGTKIEGKYVEGDYNNIIAAIISATKTVDGKPLSVGWGSNQDNYYDSQVALFYFWNDWVKEVNTALAQKGYTSKFTEFADNEKIAKIEKYNPEYLLNEYKKLAEINSYTATIYLLQGRSAWQNIIVVEKGPKEPKGLTVTKKWIDGGNTANRSDIEVQLYRVKDGVETPVEGKKVILNKDNNWSFTYTDLPSLDNAGNEIIYTVKELNSPPGYISTGVELTSGTSGSASSSYTITNTKITKVTVKKEWEDKNNADGLRPESIKVTLYSDTSTGAVSTGKTVELNAANKWTHTFENLNKYDLNNNEIKYTIKEDKVLGFEGTTATETDEQGNIIIKITNKAIRDINVEKVWEDNENEERLRPSSIKVQLYKNGEAVGQKIILDGNVDQIETEPWKTKFTGLDKYDKNGLIKYEIVEDPINEYEVSYTTTTDENGNLKILVTNEHNSGYDGYIEITGKAWLDGVGGKSNNINGIFDENDSLLEGITARLKYIDEQGNHQLFNPNLPKVYETKTDANGEYKIVVNYDNSENVYKLYEDIETVNKKLETAYVEFEYDGLKYTTVNNEISTKKILNPDGSETIIQVPSSEQSKAIENETSRNKFDSKHSNVTAQTTIPDKWSDKNITASTKTVTSYEKDKDEMREVVVKYCNGNGTYDRTNPNGACSIIKNQKFKTECDNCNGKGHSIETFEITVQKIPNINLGLFEREQPDVAIFSDLSKVEVTMKDQKYTYLYNVRSNENNDVGLQVKFQNKGTYTYRRPVNPADIAYIQEEANKNAMNVLVTYEVKVANLSSTLQVTIHNIINSYDSEYTLNTENWAETQAQGFKQAKNNGDLNITLNPQEESSAIELTYTVSIDAIRKLLNQEETLNNAVEIESYSTKYGEGTLYAEQRSGGRTGKPYAGYDYDSHPGNAGIFINNEGRLEASKLEDDTDLAPSFVLCKDEEPKILSGTIWEDVDENTADKERLGDGQYNEGEAKAENVKVELRNLDGTLAKLYNKETKQLDRDAVVKSDANGIYNLDGVVTGEYYIKFTYGDDTTQLGHEATTMDGGTTKVNARNYKSTTIEDEAIKNILNKDYSNFGEEEQIWHITHKDGYSVAVDNMGERTKIEDLYQGNFDSALNMTAYTKPFKNKLEFDETDKTSSVKTDGENRKEINGSIEILGYIEDATNTLDKLDFGIAERAREDLFVEKTITYLRIILANGQVLTEGNPNENIKYAKTMGLNQQFNSGAEARNALEKQLLVEMDRELIQGAQLELKYAVKIINNNEIDYDYGVYDDYKTEIENVNKQEYDRFITRNPKANYYYYGESRGLSEIVAEIEFADYIDNELVYTQESTKWVKFENDTLIKDSVKTAINNGYNALQGLMNSSTKITLPRGKTYAYEQDMAAMKLLGNKDENVYDNNLEILKIDGKTARTIQESNKGVQITKSYKPGNYEPSLKAGIFEQDDDRVKIIITPPTGITNYVITYLIAGLFGLIAIVVGVIFIKRKVLTK